MREFAVGELDRVPAVLPALVDQPRGRVSPLVLDIAVAIAVAAVLDPLQGGPRVWLKRVDERIVRRPAVILVEEHQEQRRRIRCAEVGGMRSLAARGELAEAQLVQDLARLPFLEVITHVGLMGSQSAQRRRGQLR